jgi:hypothetical protein
MKLIGICFIVFGMFWSIAGFLAYASDIQLGIAVGGINMVGLGIVMVKLSDIPTNNGSPTPSFIRDIEGLDS